MNRKVLGIASFLVGSTLAACGGGGTKYPDATVLPDATPDTAKPADGAAGTGGGLAPPMAAATSKLIVPAGATLVGSGNTACTNQEPAPGDRWCAFTRPGTTLGFNELWVINVTKAAAAATTPNAPAVKCDTTDANCLRLSTGLYEDLDAGFSLNEFNGDTLIYYEEPSRAQDGFVGVVRAWRPGWAGGRKLTSDAGIACAGHQTSAAVLCIENIFVDAAQTMQTIDLHAGILTEGTGGLVPKVDTVLSRAMIDPEGVQKWHVDLSPDGASVGWSSRATPTGPEILKVQRIGDDASRKTVATDVSEWSISRDGARWLWLSKFNYSTTGAPSGTLQSAAFPDGSDVKVLAETVGEFASTGAKSVLFRSKMKDFSGDLLLMPDRDAPATVSMLDQGVAFVFDFSKDAGRVVYTKNVELLETFGVTVFDLHAVANDGKRPCVMAATPIGFLQPDLITSGEVSAWGRLNSVTGEVEGVYSNLTTCMTKKYANEILSWTPIASEGYVYLDELSLDQTLNEATLRYAKLDQGMLPAKGTAIQTRAQFRYATLLPTLPAVVYEVSSGAGTDGLYINASLPFTTSPIVPPPDGGAPDATTPDATTPDAQPDAPAVDAGTTDVAADTSPDV
jgi:hypothetical protein